MTVKRRRCGTMTTERTVRYGEDGRCADGGRTDGDGEARRWCGRTVRRRTVAGDDGARRSDGVRSANGSGGRSATATARCGKCAQQMQQMLVKQMQQQMQDGGRMTDDGRTIRKRRWRRMMTESTMDDGRTMTDGRSTVRSDGRSRFGRRRCRMTDGRMTTTVDDETDGRMDATDGRWMDRRTDDGTG